MSNLNFNDNDQIKNSGRVWSGVIIVAIGFAFLLNNMGLNIPRWIFSWSNALIILGIFIGVRKDFKGIGWLILILFGSFVTINKMHLDINLSKYALGIGLVIIGGFLVLKPKGSSKRKAAFKDTFNSNAGEDVADGNMNKSSDKYSNDIIDVTAIFSGCNQTVYTKNFKGGDITAVFGGADIHMTQADFTDSISLDVTAVFGGIKLIVPPNWAIKSNVTAAFGSVEDKRGHMLPIDQMQKTLVLDGLVLFGGIEVKSF